jgi:hypothetical protein
VCPESGDEGKHVNLSKEDDCVRVTADANNSTWHRRNQVEFVIMEKDTTDDIPALHYDKATQYIPLDLVDEGTLPAKR